MSAPVINPSNVGLIPLPEEWSVQAVKANGQDFVMIRIDSPNGTHISFLPSNWASEIAAHIKAAADTARTGLILPPN